MLTVSDILQDRENANKGSPAGAEALDHSLDTYGLVRGIAVDKDDVIIAGNQTQAAAIRSGKTKVVVVETTGDTLVVTKRLDMDFDSPDPMVRAKTRGASLADNQIGNVSQNIDMAIVREQLVTCSIVPSSCGFTQADIVPADSSSPSWSTPSGDAPETSRPAAPLGPGPSVQKMRQVVVDCVDEETQQEVYEALARLGYNPQLRTL